MGTPTVDQILAALAEVESSNNPEAWGDGGRAMGRWQVHPDRLWYEAGRYGLTPFLGETWDAFVARVLWAMVDDRLGPSLTAVEVAMYWHLGHVCQPNSKDWDKVYEARFNAALNKELASGTRG